MANVVVVGAQWGDEGKGKIVDWLSERADVIVRFQGGHNAGHTLVIEGQVYKLSLLPSGIVRGGKLSVIGNGVVLDPWHLREEIAKLSGQGVEINPENLMVAENTPLILPVHGELDRAREAQHNVAKIGTTGRGIAPPLLRLQLDGARYALRIWPIRPRLKPASIACCSITIHCAVVWGCPKLTAQPYWPRCMRLRQAC